jgi:hypothetical protein
VLAAAFECAPGLTAIDAQFAVRQGCGVLADRLDHDVAHAVSERLTGLGYESSVVSDGELALAEPFQLRRADLSSPRVLVVYDVYGRPSEIDWSSLKLVHAGTYPEGQFVTTKEAGWEIIGDLTVAWDAEHDYVETDTLVVEIVVGEPCKRYSIAPSPFDYRYLGERKRAESRENFAVLLDDLVRKASPGISWLAFRLPKDRLGLEQLRRYPSRRFFERHMKWLNWYAGIDRAARDLGGVAGVGGVRT